jgi:diacylglycerol kinase (ATP)
LSELVLLLLTLALVLVVEILNTAVEAVVDRIGLEHNELSGLAKDLGSAAVLLSLLFAAGVWLAFFWRYGSASMGTL